jgi:hypothetical protein
MLLLHLRRYNSWMRDASCVGTGRTGDHMMGKPERRKEEKTVCTAGCCTEIQWNFKTIH